MNRAWLALVVFVELGCSEHAKPALVPTSSVAEPVAGQLRGSDAPRMACGTVRASWRDAGDHVELWFALGSGTAVRFDSPELFASDRNDQLFSPDCRHVLLLVSHHGPYHIVRVDRLTAYLDGAAPDHVLAGEPDPQGITGTGVFRDGAWVSDDEVVYSWGCCDPPITTRFWLPSAASH